MDRFEWCDGSLYSGEQFVEQQTGVALYDGNDKVMLGVVESFYRRHGNKDVAELSRSLTVLSVVLPIGS